MLLGKSTFNCHVLVISHEIIMESSNGRKCSQRLEIIAGKRPGTTDLTLQVKYWDTLAPTMSMSVSRLLEFNKEEIFFAQSTYIWLACFFRVADLSKCEHQLNIFCFQRLGFCRYSSFLSCWFMLPSPLLSYIKMIDAIYWQENWLKYLSICFLTIPLSIIDFDFHSKSISRIGLTDYVCLSAITSKMIIFSACKLHRPL